MPYHRGRGRTRAIKCGFDKAVLDEQLKAILRRQVDVVTRARHLADKLATLLLLEVGWPAHMLPTSFVRGLLRAVTTKRANDTEPPHVPFISDTGAFGRLREQMQQHQVQWPCSSGLSRTIEEGRATIVRNVRANFDNAERGLKRYWRATLTDMLPDLSAQQVGKLVAVVEAAVLNGADLDAYWADRRRGLQRFGFDVMYTIMSLVLEARLAIDDDDDVDMEAPDDDAAMEETEEQVILRIPITPAQRQMIREQQAAKEETEETEETEEQVDWGRKFRTLLFAARSCHHADLKRVVVWPQTTTQKQQSCRITPSNLHALLARCSRYTAMQVKAIIAGDPAEGKSIIYLQTQILTSAQPLSCSFGISQQLFQIAKTYETGHPKRCLACSRHGHRHGRPRLFILHWQTPS